MNLIYRVILLTISLGLSSCGGYRVRVKGNPFAERGIRSVAIPMFVNQSVYPKANVPFTREIKAMLATYPGLSISTKPTRNVDAVLIGIVSSANRYAQAYNTTARNFQNGTTIGKRAGFYVPTASKFKISVHLVMIKDPSLAEQKAIKSNVGEFMINHPKVVFSKTFFYTGSFNRDARPTDTSDSGGIVNYTNTRRYFDQTLESLAQTNARNLEQLVINVF